MSRPDLIFKTAKLLGLSAGFFLRHQHSILGALFMASMTMLLSWAFSLVFTKLAYCLAAGSLCAVAIGVALLLGYLTHRGKRSSGSWSKTKV